MTTSKPLISYPILAFLTFAVSTLLFASMLALSKTLHTYSILQIVFFRNFFGWLTVTAVIFARKEFPLLKTYRWKAHLVRGTFGLISMYFYFSCVAASALVEANVFAQSQQAVLVLLAILFLGERPPVGRWIALAIGLVGVFVLINSQLILILSERIIRT